jgi:Helix-turn-helix domain
MRGGADENSRKSERSTNRDVFQRQKEEIRKAKDDEKSFTSDKFDWLDAIMLDPRLKPIDFKVAYCIAQHLNAVSGLCNPSQRLIAELCDLKERTVRNSVARLVRAKWLVVHRPGRGSNHYRLDGTNVSPMLDRRTLVRESLGLERSYRHVDAGQEALDRHQHAARNRHGDAAKHLIRTPD